MGYLRFLLAAIVVISHSGGEIFGFKMIDKAGSNIPTPNISKSIPKNIKIKRNTTKSQQRILGEC